MKEIFRTNDAVKISFILHSLAEDGIQAFDLDRHTSVLEGSIVAIERRIMVADEDYDAALAVIQSLDLD